MMSFQNYFQFNKDRGNRILLFKSIDFNNLRHTQGSVCRRELWNYHHLFWVLRQKKQFWWRDTWLWGCSYSTCQASQASQKIVLQKKLWGII